MRDFVITILILLGIFIIYTMVFLYILYRIMLLTGG